MSAERAAMLREMMRGPPPPLPQMPAWHCLHRANVQAAKLVNYVHDGKSCWREKFPEEQRARD